MYNLKNNYLICLLLYYVAINFDIRIGFYKKICMYFKYPTLRIHLKRSALCIRQWKRVDICILLVLKDLRTQLLTLGWDELLDIWISSTKWIPKEILSWDYCGRDSSRKQTSSVTNVDKRITPINKYDAQHGFSYKACNEVWTHSPT